MFEDIDSELVNEARVLAFTIRDQVKAWHALNCDFANALNHAHLQGDKSLEIRKLLHQHDLAASREGGLSFSEVTETTKSVRTWLETFRANPEMQDIYNVLHSGFEQHAWLASADLAERLSAVNSLASAMYSTQDPILRGYADDLTRLARGIDVGEVRVDGLRELLAILDQLEAKLPHHADSAVRRRARSFRGTCLEIAIIDDEPMWREFVASAAAEIQASLGAGYSVSICEFTNTAEARAALCSTSHGFGRPIEEDRLTIAVVDMGLPKDLEHEHLIRAGQSAPDRKYGQELLADLRSYAVNIPCVVLTAGPHLLDDQRRACRNGVPDDEYFIKGFDKIESLRGAILNIWEKGRRNRVRIEVEPNQLVVNDVEIPVANIEMAFQVVHALCETKQYTNAPATIEDICGHLRIHFPNTILELDGWAASNSQGSDQRIRKWIADQIYTMRQAIHDAFQMVHQRADKTLIELDQANGVSGYRLNAEVVNDWDDETFEIWSEDGIEHVSPPRVGDRQQRGTRVLVVEDEPLWSNIIRRQLTEFGFEIEVAESLVEGIEKATSFLPDILSLDIQIPHSTGQSPESEVGLQLLEHLRQVNHRLKVVCPTTHFNDDEVRRRATMLRVPLDCIVPKGTNLQGVNWEGLLVRAVCHLRDELDTGIIKPVGSTRLKVKVLPGSDFEAGRLKLEINGRPRPSVFQKSFQGKLVACLLLRPAQLIPISEVDAYVTGGNTPVTDSIRNQWLKNARIKIREEWLQIDDGDPAKPEQEVLERTADNRLVLNVEAVGLPQHLTDDDGEKQSTRSRTVND